MTKGQLFFSKDIKSDFLAFTKENHKSHVVFICDINTEKYCLPLFDKVGEVIVVPSGESSKNIDTFSLIIKKLIYLKTNKSSLIVNLGGGVVTDIGGFAAATYMRGIDFINIPTTLLGMVDASIGGKTGIDFQLNKNYVGSFSLPELIMIAPVFLKTLPQPELLSGSAEMIKTGIMTNSLLFNKMLANDSIESLIRMTAESKQRIVESDFLDKGERQLLNFGHTIGHAFESYRLNIDLPVLHGFAVAKGMMAESRVANYLGMINEDDLNKMIDCIAMHTQQSEITKNEFEAMETLLFMDKKNSRDEIVFSLPAGIGHGVIKVPVAMEIIKNSLFNA